MKIPTLLSVLLVFAFALGGTYGRKLQERRRASKNGDGNSTIVEECLGEELSETKLTTGFLECTEEIVPSKSPLSEGVSGDEKRVRGRKRAFKKNQMCIKFCQRKKQGILDSNGKVSETGSTKFITELFPQKAQPRIQRGLKRCAEDFGEEFSISNNCKEYKRFEKCLMRIISKSCGWKNGKKGNRNNRPSERRGRKGNNGKTGGHHRGQTHDSEDHIDDEESDAES